MVTKRMLTRRLLSSLLAVLMLCSFLVLFASCAHECMDADCAVCALIDTARHLLGALLFATVTTVIADVTAHTRSFGQRILFSAERSPIALKVKLSR